MDHTDFRTIVDFSNLFRDLRSPDLWIIDEDYTGTGIHPPITVQDNDDESKLEEYRVKSIEMEMDDISRSNNISNPRASEICEQIATDLSNTFKFIKKLRSSDGSSYRLPVYGSYDNGLCCIESDINFHLDKYSDVLALCQRILDEISKIDYEKSKFSKAELVSIDSEFFLQLTHKATEVDTVVSFTNRLRLKNAELMKLYLSLNANLKPVILFLKHILIRHNLHGYDKITTYQLFWLVIFVMQREDLLPSIMTLRSAATKTERLDPINGFTWNCSLPPHGRLVIIRSNYSFQDTPASLFISFLKLYGDFDFLRYVISPVSGYALPIDATNDSPLNMNMNSRYYRKPLFVKNVINFQDPTILHGNLFGAVRPEILNSFKFLCRCLHRNFTESTFSCAADCIEMNLPLYPVDFITSTLIALSLSKLVSPDLQIVTRAMTAAIRIIMENLLKFTLINTTPASEKKTETRWVTTKHFDYYIDSKNCDKIISFNIVPESARNTLMKMYIVCEIYSDGDVRLLMEGSARLIEFFDKHIYNLLLSHILPRVQNSFSS
ncbi:uncharacterized protein LOC135839957 [Planococcus citri]|uniref:uncharacterized protein LOC135839957 n=1 Tax=Planococcus citri TaxID=170843 RepID=UPI0031F8B795